MVHWVRAECRPTVPWGCPIHTCLSATHPPSQPSPSPREYWLLQSTQKTLQWIEGNTWAGRYSLAFIYSKNTLRMKTTSHEQTSGHSMKKWWGLLKTAVISTERECVHRSTSLLLTLNKKIYVTSRNQTKERIEKWSVHTFFFLQRASFKIFTGLVFLVECF